jgi:DNA replication protein DnaC
VLLGNSEIFRHAVAVAAMVDRLIHHFEIVVLQGESNRLKDRAKEVARACPQRC